MNLVSWNLNKNDRSKIVELLDASPANSELLLEWGDCDISSEDTLCFVPMEEFYKWKALENVENLYFIGIGDVQNSFTSDACLGLLSNEMLARLKTVELQTIFNAYLERFNYRLLENEVDLITLDVDKMREQILLELSSVKKIYQKIVPIREDQFKELNVSSKFHAGLKGGGEFFDWCSNSTEFFFYLFTTSSYTLTGELSQLFSQFIVEENFDIKSQEQLFRNINVVYQGFLRKKEAEIDFTFFSVDLKSLQLTGFSTGGTSVFTNNGDFLAPKKNRINNLLDESSSKVIYQCQKEDFLYIESLGMQKSKHELLSTKHALDLNRISQQKTRDYFDEEFLTLQSRSDSDFLPYDSTLVKIEVLKNGIFKV